MGNNIEQENRQEGVEEAKIVHTNPNAMKVVPPVMY